MKEAIIIFTRVPLAGQTKTRLEGFLSKEECKEIHENFLKDIKNICDDLNKDIFVFHTPFDKDNILKNIFKNDCIYVLQEGETLGMKMYNAIKFVLKQKQSCILIGSDIPYLKKEDLIKAFDVLKFKDIVLGKTTDLGYYLIGMKKPTKVVFENIEYGYGNVFDNTLKAILNNNLTYGLTNENRDIDTKEDIFYFYEKIKDGNFKDRYTSKFILNIMEREND
jgi:hypothetical protein